MDRYRTREGGTGDLAVLVSRFDEVEECKRFVVLVVITEGSRKVNERARTSLRMRPRSIKRGLEKVPLRGNRSFAGENGEVLCKIGHACRIGFSADHLNPTSSISRRSVAIRTQLWLGLADVDFERFMQQTYGFAPSEWDTARMWARNHLRNVARARGTATYTQLCEGMASDTGLRFEPHGTPLAGLLGQVNVLEREEGLPLISCVVVHKSGDWKPGVGFWNMSKEMGLAIGDTETERDAYWVAELKRCYDRWGL